MRFVIPTLLAATITFAPAGIARGQTNNGPVMEIVTFHLYPGITEAAFLAAAKATETMVAAQPGFVRRSLLRDETGLWTDTIHWQSLSQAQTAAATVMADPAFAAFGAAIDMASIDMRHIPILWQMGD